MQKRLKLMAVVITAVLVTIGIKYIESFGHTAIVASDFGIAECDTLNRLLVNGVNRGTIKVVVDGGEYTSNRSELYLDDDMNIMVRTDYAGRMINCAVSRYTDSRVLMEKGSDKVVFESGCDYVVRNDTKEELLGRVTLNEQGMYVPLETVAKYLGYDYEWNPQLAVASLRNRNADGKIYPFKYDYRECGRVSSVKDQANLGTCWAFASLTALESSMLPYHAVDFSEDHLTQKNGYSLSQNDGGEFNMTMAYLASWKGPVYEEQDPYGDGYSPDGVEPAVHVQEMQIIPGKDYDGIKKAVFLYGGVQSSLYMTTMNANGLDGAYYNSANSAYCYIGTKKANHDIVIVGWDDSYPADNFATPPVGDGAFLCVNSWGDDFGDDGFFYVSYYDTNIGMHNLVYTKVESNDNYDNLYQTDSLGWVGLLGYDREYAYFANVYTAKSDELLKAVGFYATTPGTRYKVYFADAVPAPARFANMELVAEGSMTNAGFFTIDLKSPKELAGGNKYGIIVYIESPNAKKPVAIECYSDSSTQNFDLNDGEGYISPNGRNWERVENTQHCNICLKMYTDNIRKEE